MSGAQIQRQPTYAYWQYLCRFHVLEWEARASKLRHSACCAAVQQCFDTSLLIVSLDGQGIHKCCIARAINTSSSFFPGIQTDYEAEVAESPQHRAACHIYFQVTVKTHAVELENKALELWLCRWSRPSWIFSYSMGFSSHNWHRQHCWHILCLVRAKQ